MPILAKLLFYCCHGIIHYFVTLLPRHYKSLYSVYQANAVGGGILGCPILDILLS